MQKNLLFALYFNLNFNLTNFFGFGINVNGITVASVFGGCKLPLDTYSQSDGCLNMGWLKNWHFVCKYKPFYEESQCLGLRLWQFEKGLGQKRFTDQKKQFTKI